MSKEKLLDMALNNKRHADAGTLKYLHLIILIKKDGIKRLILFLKDYP